MGFSYVADNTGLFSFV